MTKNNEFIIEFENLFKDEILITENLLEGYKKIVQNLEKTINKWEDYFRLNPEPNTAIFLKAFESELLSLQRHIFNLNQNLDIKRKTLSRTLELMKLEWQSEKSADQIN